MTKNTDIKNIHHTTEKFYGRRKGKTLTQTSQERFDSILPFIQIQPTNIPETPILDMQSLFATEKEEFWLEVGFGGGEHLAQQALNHKNVGLIGCEPFMNGIAKLLKDIQENELENIRIYADDARHIMHALPDASLDKAFALFGDPWRKYRHRDRRFIGPENLNTFARILKDNAILRVATDHPIYLQWILRWAPIHPDFEWLDNGPQDWGVRKTDWYETRYERKAVREGRKSSYLTFRRKPRI